MTLRYRVLRYTPNLVRDEWVNIGVLLEEVEGYRHEARLITEPGELARVRRLHPSADEDLLRALSVEFDERFRESSGEVRSYVEKLEVTLSNSPPAVCPSALGHLYFSFALQPLLHRLTESGAAKFHAQAHIPT